jgi:hypothetical protein
VTMPEYETNFHRVPLSRESRRLKIRHTA